MSYVSVIIPFEPNPKLQTEWHPTSPTGPFNVLCRGAFANEALAQAWADKNLPQGSTYSFKTYPSPEEA
jgi:hypothetical protein